jgi:prolyl 4-hydroxylase
MCFVFIYFSGYFYLCVVDVDLLPLQFTAAICVAQDLDESWPLELYGHNVAGSVATNLTMVPGDMVLYEGHSVIHGRPFHLKGRYAVSI